MATNTIGTSTSGLQVTFNSTMSQDVVATAEIPVLSTSAAPVAVFKNPNAAGVAGNGQLEALCIANLESDGQSTPQLCHVARDRSSAGGWKLVPLFGGRAASETAAGTAFPASSQPAIHGFFQDASGTYASQLQSDGLSWAPPALIQSAAVSHLRVAYTPDGLLVLYGNTEQGDLFTAYQTQVGGPFVSVMCDMQGGLLSGDFVLCLIDEQNWQLAANVNGKPMIYTGVLGATEFASAAPASQFDGTLQQVVLGYWNDSQNTLLYMFVDSDHALHVWATNAANSTTVSQPIPNSNVTRATGHVSDDGSLHVYSIDDSANLWVLHQSPSNPWNFDGTPNWAPYLALDTNVAAVASDINPAAAPSLFALDAATYSLRLHAQDPVTRMWHTGPVLQATEQAYELVRFRTEVTVLDANGNPLLNYPVTLRVADDYSATAIAVGEQSYPIDSSADVPINTDMFGKLTFAVLTTQGMVAPRFIFNAQGLDAPMTIGPADPVHTYLSGKGTLNPTNPGGALPEFDADGKTLAGAQVGGASLAPGVTSDASLAKVAATAIRHTAQVGLGQAAGGVAGYALHLADATGPSFQPLPSAEAFEAHFVQVFGATKTELGSIWGDIVHFFGDIWQGIKSGLIKIKDALVDVGEKIAHFTVQIGDWIAQGVSLAIKGLEQAAHFIAGVFHAVAAAVEKVIDWLKALFDFAAIWRTKMAFEQILSVAPAYIKQVLTLSGRAADGWFSKQKQHVDSAFASFKAQYAGQTFAQQPHWQQPGHGPSQQVVVGNASPADFGNNGHNNWLQHKVSAHAPRQSGLSPDDTVSQAWSAFATHVESASQDFPGALKDFAAAAESIVKNPLSFGSVALPDFIDMIDKLVDGLLTFADAVLDFFVAMGGTAMDGLEKFLTTELHLGFLNTLWKWIAKLAGYGHDDKLTVSALIALCAAFPVTILYKLVEGVEHEPFPDGRFPTEPTGESGLAALASSYGLHPTKGTRITSAALQMLYAFPACYAVCLVPDTPWWLTLITVGLCLIIWIAAHGTPDLSVGVWVGVGAVAAILAVIVPIVGNVIQTVMALITQQNPWDVDRIATLTQGMLTAYGIGMFILGIVLDIHEKRHAPEIAVGAFLPLPNVFAFLIAPAFRCPETIVFVAAMALLGNLIGGTAELVLATHS